MFSPKPSTHFVRNLTIFTVAVCFVAFLIVGIANKMEIFPLLVMLSITVVLGSLLAWIISKILYKYYKYIFNAMYGSKYHSQVSKIRSKGAEASVKHEVIKLKVCPKCNLDASNEYEDSAKYCSECGTELVDKLTFQSQVNHSPLPLNKPALISVVLGIRDMTVQDTPESDVTKLKVCPQCELDASNEYTNSSKYCSKCGTELVDKLSFQSKNNRLLNKLAMISAILGITEITEPKVPQKSKRIALLLAIFLGPFTWLYTYKKDAWKATVGLGLTTNAAISLVSMFVTIKYVVQSNSAMSVPSIFTFIPFMFLFIFFWFPIWVWAIIDVAKNKEWLLPGIETRNKNIAILLSVLLSPWAWFYTYKKDAWKFWVSLFVLCGNTIGFWIVGASWLRKASENVVPISFQPWWLPYVFYLVSLAIVVPTIVIAVRRSSSWYENFGKEEIYL